MTTPGGRSAEDWAASEDALVARARQGDREAFGMLVERHQGLVFRIAGGLLRDRAEVEEVAQEAFLKAFTAMGRFRPGAPFGPWIARIATRLCYDHLRQRRRRRELHWDDLPPDEQHAAMSLGAGRDAASAVAARDLAQRALAGLAPKDRQVLVLSDALGFRADEVAGMMASSALAIRVRLHRARRAMRRVVEAMLDEASRKE